MSLNRSQQMARIRSRDTAPELLLRSTLWASGLRYRLRYPTPAGRPDLVFPNQKLAVFVDGCFWHGCPEHYVRPRSGGAFWAEKLRSNVERDIEQTALLEGHGWTVLRVWEHAVFTDMAAVVDAVARRLDPLGRFEEHLGRDQRVIRAEPVSEVSNMERWTLVHLRAPEERHMVEVLRTTRKWKRPSSPTGS